MTTLERHQSSRRKRLRRNLERLLRPRHVAIVGGRLLEDAVRVCRHYGYAGPLWPVSRSVQEIAGESCFESIDALPEPPDATLILASREATNSSVRALAQRGGGGVVCYASGYAEAGARGRVLQEDLVEVAGELAVVGPNCNGLANFLDELVLWPNPELPKPPVGRGVAILAQSGAFVVNLCNAERSLPVVFAASIGNQATVDIADFIELLVDDPRVSAIGAYLESVPDADAFGRAAYRAASKGIPLVVLKAGHTPAGEIAAATHTGALAGADEMASAFFDRFAICRPYRISEFVETLKCLSVAGAPNGHRLAAIAVSGGIATLVADAASAAGLSLPAPSPAQAARIASHLPEYLSVSNPLDCSPPLSADAGLSMTNQAALERCFETVVEDGDHDLVALFIDFPRSEVEQGYLWSPVASAMAAVGKRSDKVCAVVSMLPDGLPQATRDELTAAGVAPLQGLDDALPSLSAAARYAKRRTALLAWDISRVLEPTAATAGESVLLDEVASKRWLERAGLRVVTGKPATLDDVEDVAERLGYPLVIKAVHDALPHKSKHGGVALGLSDVHAVREAVRQMAERIRAETGLNIDRFLVERHITDPIAELFVGLKTDPVWGRVVIIGAGGVDVEDVHDHALMRCPVSDTEIAAALRELRIGRKLENLGVPSEPIGSWVSSVATLAASTPDRLLELDVNPLFVLPGEELVVVDALVRVER